jgi:hypothetical protein
MAGEILAICPSKLEPAVIGKLVETMAAAREAEWEAGAKSGADMLIQGFTAAQAEDG